MSFPPPPPLSPTRKLRIATPVAHGAVGLGSLPERFMGKQIVVCRLPVPHLGARPQSSPSSSCPKARKMLHRASVPETGTLAVSHAHRSPEGDPHVIRSNAIIKTNSHQVRQLRGAVCSPNLWGPKTRAPSTFQGRLMLARRPHSRPLPQAIVKTTR
jgi:hypothetical protein